LNDKLSSTAIRTFVMLLSMFTLFFLNHIKNVACTFVFMIPYYATPTMQLLLCNSYYATPTHAYRLAWRRVAYNSKRLLLWLDSWKV